MGKSTTARLLRERRGWGTLPEACARLRPPPSLEFGSPSELIALEEELLAEECRRYREARRRCRRGESVVADTGFLGPLTYTAGLVALGRSPRSVLRTIRRAVEVRFVRGELGWPDGTIYLDLEPSGLRRRTANDPLGHPESLAERHRAVARFERRFFLRSLARRWPERVVLLRASASPEAVARRADAIASGFPRFEPSLEETVAALDPLAANSRSPAVRGARASATLKKDTRPPRAPRR